MLNLSRMTFPLLAATLALSMIACSGGDSKKKKSRKRAPNVTASANNSREVRDLFNIKSKVLEYSYNPIGKRDPFKEYAGSGKLVQVGRGGPLTAYEIDQITLVAVVWGISDPRAMVQLPDGKSYIIRRSSPIGRHFGKVARITPSSIIVEEEFRGPLGDLQIKETKMILNETAGEKLKVDEVSIPTDF